MCPALQGPGASRLPGSWDVWIKRDGTTADFLTGEMCRCRTSERNGRLFGQLIDEGHTVH